MLLWQTVYVARKEQAIGDFVKDVLVSSLPLSCSAVVI